MTDPRIQYFTICSNNYLHYALTLRDSLARVAPERAFRVFLADETAAEPGAFAALGLDVIEGAALGIPEYYDMARRYSVVEFNTSLKPYCFQHLFDRCGADAAVFLDPDVYVQRPLDAVETAFASGAASVLTPHTTTPLDDGFAPDDLRILRTGVFNLGFAAFAAGGEARAFIDWWAKHMPMHCRVDLPRGVFVDQKYVDLAPSFIDANHILHHPGYNVAYWNLHARPLTRDAKGDWLAAGEPLHFLHCSGVDETNEALVSKHQNRLSRETLGEGAALFDEYREKLRKNRVRIESAGVSSGYAFGKFSCGSAITPVLRRAMARLMLEDVVDRAAAFAFPEEALSAPAQALPPECGTWVSEAMFEAWTSRRFLQSTFNIRRPAGARAFAAWCVREGVDMFGLDARCLTPAAREQGAGSAAPLVALRAMRGVQSISGIFPKGVRRLGVKIKRRVLPFLFNAAQK